jgi:DNA-binding IclR family transcriptional regulator
MSTIKTKSVSSLERALLVLESLAASRNGLSLSELSRKLALPRSSTHCLLITLERQGYLLRNEQSGRYLFGMKLFSLANMAMSGLSLRKQASPNLRALMESTGLTVHMAILEQNEAVIVEKIESPYQLRLGTWVGKRMGVHCTAVGKALISHWTEEEIDRLIKYGLPRYNENTIVSSRKLKNDLSKVRELGYSVDDEEDTIGSRCVGAPIFDHTERVVASISVAGFSNQINSQTFYALADKVKKGAATISQTLMLNHESELVEPATAPAIPEAALGTSS